MQHLKIHEYTPTTLFIFIAVGTIASLVVLYLLFVHHWGIALAAFIVIDVLIFTIHKYTSNLEHKILEINDKGVITNTLLIKYSEISAVDQEEKNSFNGKMVNKLNYLIIKTPNQKHVFYTNSYKNSQQEIIDCIRKNMSEAKSK